jgi:hypothetical protein
MSLKSKLSSHAVYSNEHLKEPEVHIIGEIIGATDLSVDNSFCAFEVIAGKYWSCVGGDTRGQTQVDYPDAGSDSMVVWNHPLDIHYYTKTIEGWPKMVFEVHILDLYVHVFFTSIHSPHPFPPKGLEPRLIRQSKRHWIWALGSSTFSRIS